MTHRFKPQRGKRRPDGPFSADEKKSPQRAILSLPVLLCLLRLETLYPPVSKGGGGLPTLPSVGLILA